MMRRTSLSARRRRAVVAAGAVALLGGAVADGADAGDPIAGKAVYAACLGCHSVDEDDVGPRHRGVYGRRAAAVPGYAYSAALRQSNIVWDDLALDRWLAGPQAFVPGSKMFFALSTAVDRRNVIAYLRTLTVE